MFLGIDIGGTKTLIALFSSHGFILKRLKFPTPSNQTDFINSLIHNLDFLISTNIRKKIKAITVAIPGKIVFEQNYCSFKFGNLSWSDIDLVSPLKKMFNCKIFFANDANLATLYESSRLANTPSKIIYLTFSTGIGGGISENGKLLSSSDSFEPGHKIYSYYDKTLEWEDLASAKALSELYSSPLKHFHLSDKNLKDLIVRLSLGLIDIISSESPNLIIIGGPLSYLFNQFKKPLISSLKTALETQIPRSKASSTQKSSTEALKVSNAPKRQNLPKFIKSRHPLESTIRGTYIYSKQHYQD